MRVAYAVMAHKKRATWARALQAQLGCPVAMDDGSLGENANGDRAWGLIDPRAEFGAVIQDDAILAPDFTHQLEQALLHLPERGAVSLYTGTARPYPQAITRAVELADEKDASWLQGPQMFWGPAIVLPAEHIEPMLAWAKKSFAPYDNRIGLYCNKHRVPIFYSHPSLVDHRDEESLLAHKPSRPRVAHRFGTREAWNDRSVCIPVN